MDNWDHKSKYFQWDYMKHKMFRFRARITLVLLGSSQQGWVRSVGMSLLLSWLHRQGGVEGKGFWCFIPLLSVGYTSMVTVRVGFTSDVSLLPTYLLNGKLCYAQGGNCSQSQHMGPISGSIPASSDVQGTWLGFQVLACQKLAPPSILIVTQETRETVERS